MKALFRGIGWRIFLSFATLLIVLVLSITFLGLKFSQKMAIDNASNELRVLTITLGGQIQKYLRRIESDLKTFGSSGGTIDKELLRDRVNSKKLTTFLNSKKAQHPNFEDLAVFDVNGRCVAATDPSWVGLFANREPFFINGLKRYGFAEIFESRDSEKILLVSTPINEGMDPHGVLVGQIKLSALYDLIGQKLGLKGNTIAYLLDSKLRLITSDKGIEEKKRESILMASPLLNHLQDEFWVGRYEGQRGVEVLGTISKIQGRAWYLVLEKDFALVEAELGDIKNFLFTATLILLGALMLTTIFITHSITKPIRELVGSAQKIADGDFSQPIVVPTGIDEITFLTNEFENMRARIAASQGRLIEQLAESEQRRLENERLAAIGTLASSLAHEIRNPLNALSLLLSQLERQKPEQNRAAAFDSMRLEIARLDRLVTDILDYSKPLQLSLEKIELGKFLTSTLEFYKPLFEEKKISLTTFFESGETWIKADPARLRQALVNIFQNAIDAMEKVSGELVFSFVRTGSEVEIRIQDNGVGIREGTQRRLFDLFFTTKEKGTGLGLSTVRKIIDAHGGKIFLEAAPHRGTLVRIILALTH